MREEGSVHPPRGTCKLTEVDTHLHVLVGFHPSDGVEAEPEMRVLPPSWVSQGVVKIQEQMVKESRGKT